MKIFGKLKTYMGHSEPQKEEAPMEVESPRKRSMSY